MKGSEDPPYQTKTTKLRESPLKSLNPQPPNSWEITPKKRIPELRPTYIVLVGSCLNTPKLMSEENDYSQPAAMAAEFSARKRKKSKSKSRFSDEQIRSLEIMFETETKLEPRKKLQVARELGLQPRQVAIWFQNKRARWKSKQLESNYGTLQANYNALSSNFEALKKEKKALLIQLQKLNDLMQKSREERKGFGQDAAEDSIGDQLGRGEDIKSKFEAKPSLLLERAEEEMHVFSDDDGSIQADYFGLDTEPELVSLVEPADSSENWGSLDTEGGLLDESGSSFQWWDFWT